MGPVPPPGVAGPGHPTRRGPDGGVPWGWRNPTVRLSLSPLPFCLAPYSPQIPCWRGSLSPAPMEGRAGPGVGGRKSPQQGGRVGWPEPRCWSRFLSLSTPIPCPSSRHWGGGEAWAGLLALRGPGPFYRSVSGDGGGDPGPGSGRPAGRPRSGWRVPDTCEYEGGVRIGLWWIRAVTKPRSIKA